MDPMVVDTLLGLIDDKEEIIRIEAAKTVATLNISG
jgi:hypothetical protein